ncbi:MAG: dehydrogenase, partial [Phycisphaerae bacterium]
MRTGQTEIAEVPCPRAGRGQLLIQTTRSLISAGTERMLTDFARGSMISKALKQPDRVRQVLQKVKTDGLQQTAQTVFSKLDEP